MPSTATNYVSVEPDGDSVAAHFGLHALGALADRLELGSLLSSRIAPRGERLPFHDRGMVLTQMALVLAGGGESCADIEHLRVLQEMFGSVPSKWSGVIFNEYEVLIVGSYLEQPRDTRNHPVRT